MERFVFKLPDIGEGIAEAEVVSWHVKVGELVAEDDPLVDVMTDKATVELSSPRTGRILSLAGNPGDKLRIGSELVVLDLSADAEARIPEDARDAEGADGIGDDGAGAVTVVGPEMAVEGETAAELPEPMVSLALAPARRPEASPGQDPARHHGRTAPLPAALPAVQRAAGAKPLASPAVRRRAQELGIALRSVRGTGPAGRIQHTDLDACLAAGGSEVDRGSLAASLRDGVQEIKVIGLRRRIAERMQESKRRIPHYSYVEELDVTTVEELRAHLNARKASDQPKLTLLPFIVRAVVRAVARFPQINATYDDEAGVVRQHEAVHLGMATQTDQGLMVPVLRHAEAMDLWECAVEILRLASAVREGKATRDELTGSTITVTSLGPLGGIAHTPVINHPEVAIVGVNRMVERPVVRGGQIVVRRMMNLSSSFDHRVVDGWDAAEFIQEVKGLLEQPATLFIEGAAR